MKLALIHDAKLPAAALDAIAAALSAGGNEVDRIDAADVAALARRLAAKPGLAIDATRGLLAAALCESLGVPVVGADARGVARCEDRWLSRLAVAAHGVDAPRSRLVTDASEPLGLSFPLVVGGELVKDGKALAAALKAAPLPTLVEEWAAGVEVCVGILDGVDDGALAAVDHQGGLADLPRDVLARLRVLARRAAGALGLRDLGLLTFRACDDGRLQFLAVAAHPDLEPGGVFAASAARAGLGHEAALAAVVRVAAVRAGLIASEPALAPAKKKAIRVGFAYNLKRVSTKGGDDQEAEYDPPETINAIAAALESFGHAVVHLEATTELPRLLAEAGVDVVFNVAEGLFAGRNREAQVPALCELLGIPYTGSDSATLAIALDKALTKKVLKQHGIPTPEFQLFETGREKVSAAMRYPVIVKPNAEGSSKGIGGKCVFDDEAGLREGVKGLIERYRQPALAEEYILGREFTIGLLGDRRPRILPPMEICFLDKSVERPVYDFDVKQHWEKHVKYACPPVLTPAELRSIERASRDTFEALECRDVARVDIRMNAQGVAYVLEVNPLPGLTPDYSDLVLICKAAGIDYRTLVGEILAGGLRRMRETRRRGG